ncbi:DNA polymerase IV [Texcoconibacillus texcoconensis]|uniref:DNA polymerase IV n=1 Tax=Texcoconibacillus texcoconensis TaxID=1095777 RepID=A0A840QNV8_9BACI|nr:DNA polymerase IV [Texcoconibacillus texcoconensis]MBB5173023.1 DNA polymerase-4 [Texcoconibacillus texcoconensis]
MDRQRKGRIIFHVDMNSFYASVEAAHDPSLRGKPLAIAGSIEERRGIVVTASYEARAQGVNPPMPLWEAKKSCPDLVVRKPDFPKYRQASENMFQLLYEYTPLVEPVSIDEGYMDVTHPVDDRPPLEIAKHIQDRLLKELALPSSIGVAPNKFLAKMASDMKKPLGITVLRKRSVPDVLWPLDVIEMHGVGEKTAEKLKRQGITTIGELAKSDPIQLKSSFGVAGVRMHERAYGEDHRQVDPDAISEFKSIGNSTTLPRDTKNEAVVRKVLMNLSDSVSRRMRRKEVYGGNIQLTIRYKDRKTITRSRKLDHPISSSQDIYEEVWALFQQYWDEKPIRLLGVTAQDIVEKGHAHQQLDLFQYADTLKREKLSNTVDHIRNKFGEGALLKGAQMSEDSSDLLRDEEKRGTSLEKDFLREGFLNEKQDNED